MSGQKRAGICMRRRPKEQVQQPHPDSDDETVQLLSPIRTEAKRPASNQKKTPQPRKPRVPAWQAEAIRLEAERARAHFKEIDEFELLEEVASPEPIKQVTEQVAPALTPQEDTENVPPSQHSLEVEDSDCSQRVRESQQFQELPGATHSKVSTTSTTFATPEAGTPDSSPLQKLKDLVSAEPLPVQGKPSIGSAISELLEPSDLGTTPSLSRLLRSTSNAATSANAQSQPATTELVVFASDSRATPGVLETPHNAATPSNSLVLPATAAVAASHRLSESDGAYAIGSVAKRSEQRPSSVSSALHNITPSSFKSLSEQLSQLTPVVTPAASAMLEASHVALVPTGADAPAQPVNTLCQIQNTQRVKAPSEPHSAHSIDSTSVPAALPAAGHADPPEESLQNSASCLETPLSSPSQRNTRQSPNSRAPDGSPVLERPHSLIHEILATTECRAKSAQAATPVPMSRRQKKLLKARVSMVLPDASVHPSQYSSRQEPPPRRSQASADGAHAGTPGVCVQNLYASHRSSIQAARSDAHTSPQPRTALLNSLLSRRSAWSVNELCAQQADVIDLTQATPQQTPPCLYDNVSNRCSARQARGSITTMAPRHSIMPDPSPIYEQSEASDRPSISSVGEIPAVATPVPTTVPSADYKASTVAAAIDSKPQTATEVTETSWGCSKFSGQPQDDKASPEASAEVSSGPSLDAENCLSPEAASKASVPTPSVGEHSDVLAADAVSVGTPAQPMPTPASILEPKTAALNPLYVSGQPEAAAAASVLQTDSSTFPSLAMSASTEGTAIRQAASTDTAASSYITEALSPLEELLMLCNQSEPMAFKAAMNELTGGKKVEKLAEGSFKEVFSCGSDVIQVMPIEGTSLINDLEPMSADKVIPEITALAQLARLHTPTPALNDAQGSTSCCTAFPNTKRVVVVYGKYHAPLLAAWKRFAVKWAHDEDKCQNESPGKLPASQLYIIMVVQNGGCDLEGFSIKDFKTAKNLLLQATLALAVAESCLEFEHRDLHWGNILVDTVPDHSSQVYRLRGQDWNVRGAGIKICLIDFTLSRLTGPHGTVKCSDLGTEDMSWLFTQIEEVVSPQTEAYYAMKQQAEKQWRKNGLTDQQCWHTFTPCTNVQWIAYLAKILRYKRYKKHKGETYKGVSMTSKELSSLSAFMKDLDPDTGSQWTTSCEKLVQHPFFADMLES